jgi:hypothetical protein
MRLIAHRACTNGPDAEIENKPYHIDQAINKGFDVECDVWYLNNNLYLGHDNIESTWYEIDWSWLRAREKQLWIHCKNLDAFHETLEVSSLNVFYHTNEDFALTSHGFIWTYPGNTLTYKSIAVLPEKFPNQSVAIAEGICSDYIGRYK